VVGKWYDPKLAVGSEGHLMEGVEADWQALIGTGRSGGHRGMTVNF
jgi:hypothetical protein